jgi:hypothetical protein
VIKRSVPSALPGKTQISVDFDLSPGLELRIRGKPKKEI